MRQEVCRREDRERLEHRGQVAPITRSSPIKGGEAVVDHPLDDLSDKARRDRESATDAMRIIRDVGFDRGLPISVSGVIRSIEPWSAGIKVVTVFDSNFCRLMLRRLDPRRPKP